MESKRCPACGLINYTDASCCRRCGWMPSGASDGQEYSAPVPPAPRGVYQGPTPMAASYSPQPAPSYAAPHSPYGSPASFGAPTVPKPQGKGGAAAAGVLSAIAVVAVSLALPQQVRIAVSIGTLAGLVTSLLPYFVARSRGHAKLGMTAIPVCTVCGAVLGLLLAIPVAIVFTLISVARPAVTTR